MKQPRKLTNKEKQILTKWKLDPADYLAVTHTIEALVVVKRGTKEKVTIYHDKV